jgi:4-aminobutyrate aminotransferase / (S)-3-amino-2-methylpropionate transaminase / 5-aminovalerate transaminase
MANSDLGAKMLSEVPGPRARELLDRRARYVARGASNLVPTFAARGKGALIEDVDGNRFIDFAGGIGVLNVGHAHPEVVEAIKGQVERFLHTCFHVMMYEPYIDLAQRLTEITPGDFPKKALLVNSGAEAVENSVKIARYATGRPAVFSFDFGFHGRTALTMALTGKVRPYKYGFGPLASEVYHAPSPYCYRCPAGREASNCQMECLGMLKQAFNSRVAPDKVAAVIIEPVQGEGGFIVIPPDYMRALRELCSQHGILLIIDEVQSAFGRTGKMFATEHSGVEPDLLVLAKSLGAGVPLSAVVGRTEIMDAPHVGGLGGTYGGNPVGCVAALKVIEIMQRDNLPSQGAAIGELVYSRLKAMQERYPLIGDVRGLGAMVAMELVRDRKTKEPADMEATAVAQGAFKRGLVLLKAGMFDNVLRVLVPLVAEESQLQEGLDILEASIQAAVA